MSQLVTKKSFEVKREGPTSIGMFHVNFHLPKHRLSFTIHVSHLTSHVSRAIMSACQQLTSGKPFDHTGYE